MKLRIIVPMLAASVFLFSFSSIRSNQPGKGATSTVIDISGEYNPMCGESIMVSGSLHIVEQTVKNKNKTRTMLMANYQGVSGVGTQSGKRYNITFSQKNVQTLEFSSGRQTVAVSFSENLIAPGQGVVNFSVKGYYSLEPDGTVSANDFQIVFCE
ncbi:MAG TPA: hypothetical protein VLA58_11515 [Chitinophagaceae bacterium]|nr:hypothetical protein [Chitinophagaceae bacterium]